MSEIERLTLVDLTDLARHRKRIAMITAYDAASAALADAAGLDIILVGDSAAMTILGHQSTLPVTMDEMLLLTRAVTRGVRRAFVVADLPFGAYQLGEDEALRNAIRFVKDAGADAVKLEGAGRTLTRISAILDAGIPVMGHVGLTPQSASLAGSYKARGRTAADARRIFDEARALERAGCFAVVLEAIPAPVASRITDALKIPTIGIGAGPSCDGQVLVWHDLLGLTRGHVPRFVKRYADLSQTILDALQRYAADVRSATFPDDTHTYGMPAEELARFEAQVGDSRADQEFTKPLRKP
ncbi:MAG TPA: 3-methyl-2-oxobutanoate hydroxymethyltransferase [Vicinamibacterales bacterium]|jgi:3-methyl-2-oxobutanoate hydroxymethyltransferase|nr:3-methyl-2-oxobutanoate hydroxymethyltransferase [Vicinamibacterales bacterium]